MILGVGVDLVDVSRMERVLARRWADRFIERVFTHEEIAACRTWAHPAQGYAARFAAKEALAKALGTGFTRGITPRRIRVRGGERSQPKIELIGAALEVAKTMRVASIHVSLSHTETSACAVVVVETSDTNFHSGGDRNNKL